MAMSDEENVVHAPPVPEPMLEWAQFIVERLNAATKYYDQALATYQMEFGAQFDEINDRTRRMIEIMEHAHGNEEETEEVMDQRRRDTASFERWADAVERIAKLLER